MRDVQSGNHRGRERPAGGFAGGRLVVEERFGRPPSRSRARSSERRGRVRWSSAAWTCLVSCRLGTRTSIRPGSVLVRDKRPWWRCVVCGHEWQAAVANRTLRGSGCPECAVRRRARFRGQVDAERSLAILQPDLACPACWARRRGARFGVVPAERSLAHRAPRLAAELHPTRNGPAVDPSTLGASSQLKLWWRCGACGHEWRARVADRSAGTGCPVCARRRRTARPQAGKSRSPKAR